MSRLRAVQPHATESGLAVIVVAIRVSDGDTDVVTNVREKGATVISTLLARTVEGLDLDDSGEEDYDQ